MILGVPEFGALRLLLGHVSGYETEIATYAR